MYIWLHLVTETVHLLQLLIIGYTFAGVLGWEKGGYEIKCVIFIVIIIIIIALLTCVLLLLSYVKGYDPGNWFTVDEETAEIKLNKAPDRESPFLVNGTYIAKILAISKGMYVSKIIQVCYYYFNFWGGTNDHSFYQTCQQRLQREP